MPCTCDTNPHTCNHVDNEAVGDTRYCQTCFEHIASGHCTCADEWADEPMYLHEVDPEEVATVTEYHEARDHQGLCTKCGWDLCICEYLKSKHNYTSDLRPVDEWQPPETPDGAHNLHPPVVRERLRRVGDEFRVVADTTPTAKPADPLDAEWDARPTDEPRFDYTGHEIPYGGLRIILKQQRLLWNARRDQTVIVLRDDTVTVHTEDGSKQTHDYESQSLAYAKAREIQAWFEAKGKLTQFWAAPTA